MFNQFTSDSILYYPTIEFQSETWVKQALTFWDIIYRIVPEGYDPKDSDEIGIAKSNGFIKDIKFSDSDLKEAMTNFEEYCETLEFLPSGFNSSDYGIRLHASKMDDRLRTFFKQYAGEDDSEGFYKVPTSLANGYMFFLAESVSKSRGIGRLTDNADMFTAMIHFDSQGDFPEIPDYEAEEIYSTLIIENLIPLDIKSIKMETVLDLSTTMKNWKADFRKSVSDFNEQLSKIEDHVYAAGEVEKFKKSMIELKLTRKEALKSFVTELVPALLYVGVPTSISGIMKTIVSDSKSVFDISALATNVFIGGVAGFASAGGAVRKEWSAKRANYFLEVKKHLISTDNSTLKLTNFSRRLDEYIND